MKEDVEKRVWVTPEIVDLDVSQTEGGLVQNAYENSSGIQGTMS